MHDAGPQQAPQHRSADLADRKRAGGLIRPGASIPVRAVCAALLVLAGWVPRAADAQIRAGGHGVYQTGVFEGSFGVGGRAEAVLDFIAPGLTVAGTYDHFFPGCVECSAFNAGLQVLIAPPSALYLGLGADYGRFSDGAEGTADTDWSMSLVAGIRVPVLPVVVPFIELRQQFWSTSINEQTLSLGVILSPVRARNAPLRPRPR